MTERNTESMKERERKHAKDRKEMQRGRGEVHIWESEREREYAQERGKVQKELGKGAREGKDMREGMYGQNKRCSLETAFAYVCM